MLLICFFAGMAVSPRQINSYPVSGRNIMMRKFVACVRRVLPGSSFDVYETAAPRSAGECATQTEWTSLTAYKKRGLLMDLPEW